MDYSWFVPIENLWIWRHNNWMRYELKSNNYILRVNCDQVLIMSESKVMESFNINNNIKGIYKQDVLVLHVSLTGKEKRKIKFQIKNNTTYYFQNLGQYFPVVCYDGTKLCIPSKYKNFNEVLGSVLVQLSDDHDRVRLPLPNNYHNFVKLCLLDPGFPQVVKETKHVLMEMLKNKK